MDAARARRVWAPLTDVRHGQCRWAGCALPTDTFVLNDKTVLTESLYCRDHSCLMFGDDDVLCRFPNSPFSSFCDNHIRCVARLGEGARCQQLVRERRPGLYRFCAELHGCVEADCKNERDRRGPRGDDLRRCRDHRCEAEACSGLRRDNGHCETHTCASADCRAVVRGPGAAADDAGRFCDLHRQCQTDGCNEPAKRRRTDGANRHVGAALAFCREHGCRTEGCGRRRPAAGDFCHDHTCAAPECRNARAAAPPERRGNGVGPSYYCSQHQCAEPGCRAQRVRGPRCPDHRPCARAGCANFVDAEPNAMHCAMHLCAVRGCVGARLGPGAGHCRAHTCGVAGCVDRRMASDGLFCGAHGCRRRDCRDRVLGDEGLCEGHTRHGGPVLASRPEPGPVPREGPEPAAGGECVAM